MCQCRLYLVYLVYSVCLVWWLVESSLLPLFFWTKCPLPSLLPPRR